MLPGAADPAEAAHGKRDAAVPHAVGGVPGGGGDVGAGGELSFAGCKELLDTFERGQA